MAQAKMQYPIQKITKAKKGLGVGSSGRALALQGSTINSISDFAQVLKNV
jgi:hypothetical protein